MEQGLEWDSWQTEQLDKVLTRAARFVPHYRRLWDERKSEGTNGAWRNLDNWPVLRKETVRNDPESFLAEGRRAKKLFRFHTSGSTGTPLSLWIGRANLRQWYALADPVLWRDGVGVGRQPWVIFGGQIVVPVEVTEPPFWVWNHGLRRASMCPRSMSLLGAFWRSRERSTGRSDLRPGLSVSAVRVREDCAGEDHRST